MLDVLGSAFVADERVDVLVAGGGPAGWAIAAACAREGLRTTLVDPTPDRPWRPTYGAWRDELPAAALAGAVAARGPGEAIGTVEHALGWEYVVLDNAALLERFAAAPVQVRTGRVQDAAPATGGVRATLGAGPDVYAAVLIDATGARRSLLGGHPRRSAAEQTAVGVVVDEELAAGIVAPGVARFMDWRPDHGEDGWPSFLYAVPVAPGRVLLEETSLARRPGLALSVLRRRLTTRLARHGVRAGDGAPEHVRFTVDRALPPMRSAGGPIVPFGAATPLTHPATGYSVATALCLAPRVATAVCGGLDRRPGAAGAAAWRVLWSPAALTVHALRRRGLEVLLGLPPQRVPEFFDLFFALPARHRWAYLTGRDDVTGSVAAMTALFRSAPGWWRQRLILGGLFDPRS